jgi:cobalamin-dependent methionine synthase I
VIPAPAMSAPRVLRDIPLEIDPDEVLRFQGYKRGGEAPGPEVRALLDEALALGDVLMEPRAAVRWHELRSRTDDRLVLADDLVFTVPGIARAWGAVTEVAGAVVTIGRGLEQRVAALWEARELPLAAMLDSVGSGAVESLAEHVNDVLCQEGIARGVKVTNRISPGYGGWDVAEQPLLFRMVSGAPVGVTLNEMCFMSPEKSITLLVGAGPDARVDHYFSQCARCWMAACAYRRAPAARTVHR